MFRNIYLALIALCLLQLLSIWPPPAKAAITEEETYKVYEKLVRANGFKYAPLLIFRSKGSPNAEGNGIYIIVNRSLLSHIRNSSEIAIVLAHELAHGILHHSSSNYKNELEADALGAKLMSRAGYDKCVGIQLALRLFPNQSSRSPSAKERAQHIGC